MILLPNGATAVLCEYRFVAPDWNGAGRMFAPVLGQPTREDLADVIQGRRARGDDPVSEEPIINEQDVDAMARLLASYAKALEAAVVTHQIIMIDEEGRLDYVPLHSGKPCDCAERAKYARGCTRTAERTVLVKVAVS